MAKAKKQIQKPLKKHQELIKRRRGQMLVHSCLYYEMDSPIISDEQWQIWADELEKLQEKHEKDLDINFFDYEFRDWTGATGAHLPHRHPWVYAKAQLLMRYEKS